MIGLAIPVLALYIFWGREARSHTVRQVLWIAAASQALAVVVVILAFILNWLASCSPRSSPRSHSSFCFRG